eukprot:CAMPEP_0181210498 /NCGR_PEP_ID=MMETSP1096-20121128/23260_1 /TAXON_ID=156174 ORGANISM="Chrysochromulina ericina, Strain CCMP281" /NCGR_SAMPLE_ID=MMETSP1096 /ASSEMBLY_ACC=CAM_ASM_000453 /LENGTH=94 /DNA_ID=CAMNT_0023301787 /DNA_START=51 /DNA_END=335 /DNA_ORIENTATION=-
MVPVFQHTKWILTLAPISRSLEQPQVGPRYMYDDGVHPTDASTNPRFNPSTRRAGYPSPGSENERVGSARAQFQERVGIWHIDERGRLAQSGHG